VQGNEKTTDPGTRSLEAVFWEHQSSGVIFLNGGHHSCKEKMVFGYPGSRSYAPKLVDWSLLLEQMTLYQNKVRVLLEVSL